jgi:TonB family protein
MFPKSPTHFKNALTPLIDNTNQGSQVLNPLYPYEAYRNNISGWVILKLFISKVGKVVDVEVLDSSPKGIFENTAIKAAYKREFPIDENILEPKAFTKNILNKYNAANHNL